MRVGALIVADNADWSPDYLARVRSPDQGYMSVPFAEDIELSMRVAASQKEMGKVRLNRAIIDVDSLTFTRLLARNKSL